MLSLRLRFPLTNMRKIAAESNAGVSCSFPLAYTFASLWALALYLNLANTDSNWS
jgi:hypothetical protein